VHDVVFHEHFESRKKFVEVKEGFFLCKFAFGLDFLLKSSLIAEFVDKVIIVGGFEDFDEANYVSGILDFGEGVDFIDGEFLEFGAGSEFLDLDDFDGNYLAGLFVVGFVDFSEFSGSHCGFQDVVLYFLSHLRFPCSLLI
jgi:hypothetical protein